MKSRKAKPAALGPQRPPLKRSSSRDKILSAIRRIPRGKVSTYGAVSKAAGMPRGARQVVAALRSAAGLPWQRVLGAGGAIKLRGDYAFEQRFQLEAEGVTFRGRKVDMKSHEYKFPKPKRKAGP
jgi:methylated-DNA-protein-cysteine methyltransferase-like protein